MTGTSFARSSIDRGLEVVVVAAGGAIGASARYGVELFVGPVAGTFAVNVVGAFGLAVITARVLEGRLMLFAGTGVLSSFTTYSTFVADAVSADPAVATGYVVASYVGGFLAAAAGLAVGGRSR